MTDPLRPSRRRLAQWLAVLLSAIPQLARAQPLDQAIGGTGVVPDPKDTPSDQNIGGTGVIGTIRRFGSIYVNDMRISYPDDLSVMLDDAIVSSKALQIGQVVRVVAAHERDALVARSITVVHEVVGPVDAIGPDSIMVLGQTVSLENDPPTPDVAVGQTVAVSGLRRLDGTIVASLVEAVATGTLRVAGPLIRAADGSAVIGGLTVVAVDGSLIGRRVELAGAKSGSSLAVTRAVAERAAMVALGPSRWSIEAYVARTASGLQLGSGLKVGGDVAFSTTETLAIVTAAFGAKHDHLVTTKVEVAPVAASSTQGRTKERASKTRSSKGEKGGSKAGSNSSSSGGKGGHK